MRAIGTLGLASPKKWVPKPSFMTFSVSFASGVSLDLTRTPVGDA
jgi:hypothetical protein